MIFLVDHNLEGHSLLLAGNIASLGWLDLLPIRFVIFEEIELAVTSNDRVVWRFAQANKMILLTANRSMRGKNSLEQVMREENTSNSLPVITIGVDKGSTLNGEERQSLIDYINAKVVLIRDIAES